MVGGTSEKRQTWQEPWLDRSSKAAADPAAGEGKYPLFFSIRQILHDETKAAANARESAEATCAKESAAVVRGRGRESAVVVGGRRWRRRGSGQGEVAGESEVSVRGVKAVELRAVGANSKSLVT
jgi:hypothetical protein